MPRSIRLVEFFVLTSLGLGVIIGFVGYKQASEFLSPPFFWTMVAVGLVFTGGFMLWMTRARSNVAKWVWVVLVTLGTVMGVRPLMQTISDMPLLGLLRLAQTVLQVSTLWLVFQPDAKAWFARQQAPDAAVFD